MKQSLVRPGTVAMLSLGRKGAIRVTVLLAWGTGREWLCVDASGRERVATARQLQPMPGFTIKGLPPCGPGRPGQTIDAGDVVITTTLHRLG